LFEKVFLLLIKTAVNAPKSFLITIYYFPGPELKDKN